MTIDPNTGVISGTIGTYAAGTYNVTISASDNGHVGSTQFTWTVKDTTAPALTSPGPQSSNEGQTINLQLQYTDADSFTAQNLPPGLSINNSGLISGTISQPGDGTYNVVITTTDTDNTTNPSTTISFTWTVADNLPPALTTPGPQTSNEGQTINLPIQAVDADAGSFTDVVNGQHTLPPGLTIDPNTGVISGTISAYAAGTYNVTISATDGTGNVGSIVFTWTVKDTTPPSFTISNQTSDEGAVITNLATNPVDADPNSITDVVNGQHTLPPGLTIDPTTGVISGTINPYAVTNGQPSQTFTVTLSATDGTIVGSTTFTWTVNDTTPPKLTQPPTQKNNEGDKVSLPISATDAESFTAAGLPPGLSINSSTGLISGTIGPYADGSYTVTVTASNGALSSSTTFTWNVADTTPPSFTNPGTRNNNEGDQVNLALNPVDADAGSITATGLPPGLSIDPTTGVISGVIGLRAAGTYSVVVNATDGTVTGSTRFTWNVADTTPPALTNPGPQSSNEDTAINLTIQAVDADSFSATGLPPGLSINPSTGVISGTVLGASGTFQVTVSATDGSAVNSITFPWTVNQIPIAIAITNVQNTYVGLYQVETVTAQVTDPLGIPVNEGIVTFLVNGETVLAPVSNGFATAIIVTPLLSMNTTILLNDFFPHALDAVFSDPAGIFSSGSTSISEAAMFLDFLLYLQTVQFSSLALQLAQS